MYAMKLPQKKSPSRRAWSYPDWLPLVAEPMPAIEIANLYSSAITTPAIIPKTNSGSQRLEKTNDKIKMPGPAMKNTMTKIIPIIGVILKLLGFYSFTGGSKFCEPDGLMVKLTSILAGVSALKIPNCIRPYFPCEVLI